MCDAAVPMHFPREHIMEDDDPRSTTRDPRPAVHIHSHNAKCFLGTFTTVWYCVNMVLYKSISICNVSELTQRTSSKAVRLTTHVCCLSLPVDTSVLWGQSRHPTTLHSDTNSNDNTTRQHSNEINTNVRRNEFAKNQRHIIWEGKAGLFKTRTFLSGNSLEQAA